MTKEQVIKCRERFNKHGYYEVYCDNGKLMYHGIDNCELIYDDDNELIYMFKTACEAFNSVNDTLFICGNYEDIQYFSTYTKPAQRNDILTGLVNDGTITEELKLKILETFK